MKLFNYLKDTRSELRHVSWPTRKQAVNYTALVIGLSIVVSIILGFFDVIYDFILKTYILKT